MRSGETTAEEQKRELGRESGNKEASRENLRRESGNKDASREN